MTFGLYAAEELTAADGKTIPADGLIEVISLDESGHGKAISDLPMGSYYVQEISTNSAYIVSDAKYKDGSVIFCDVCIRKILDEQKEKKERKEQPNE